jgi:hypothetical protein
MAVVSKSGAIAAAATSVVASLTAATALAVPPPPSSTFKGVTSQLKSKRHKVTIVTDANGHVSKMNLGWRAQCKKKGIFWSTQTAVTGGSSGVPQNGDIFHQAGTYTGNAGGGVTGQITVSFAGQFTDNDHANGSWKSKVTVMKNGKVIDRCKSGKITWSVARTG